MDITFGQMEKEFIPVGTRIVLKLQKENYKYYTGKQGTVVSINRDNGHVEYGINFGLPMGASIYQVQKASSHAWFKPEEVMIM